MSKVDRVDPLQPSYVIPAIGDTLGRGQDAEPVGRRRILRKVVLDVLQVGPHASRARQRSFWRPRTAPPHCGPLVAYLVAGRRQPDHSADHRQQRGDNDNHSDRGHPAEKGQSEEQQQSDDWDSACPHHCKSFASSRWRCKGYFPVTTGRSEAQALAPASIQVQLFGSHSPKPGHPGGPELVLAHRTDHHRTLDPSQVPLG